MSPVEVIGAVIVIVIAAAIAAYVIGYRKGWTDLAAEINSKQKKAEVYDILTKKRIR